MLTFIFFYRFRPVAIHWQFLWCLHSQLYTNDFMQMIKFQLNLIRERFARVSGHRFTIDSVNDRSSIKSNCWNQFIFDEMSFWANKWMPYHIWVLQHVFIRYFDVFKWKAFRWLHLITWSRILPYSKQMITHSHESIFIAKTDANSGKWSCIQWLVEFKYFFFIAAHKTSRAMWTSTSFHCEFIDRCFDDAFYVCDAIKYAISICVRAHWLYTFNRHTHA